MMSTRDNIPQGLRFLLTVASFVIVVAGLRAASTILVPLALALFVAVASLPLLNLLRGAGLPRPLSILLVVLFDAAALFMLGWLVSLTAFEVRDALPRYLQLLQDLEAETVAWLGQRGVEVGVSPFGELLMPERIFGIASLLLRVATDIITTVFLVILIFVFMLAEASSFPKKVRALLGRSSDQFDRSAKIIREIQHYLAIKTLISTMTGITIGTVTWALGLDFPLLWGLLAFLLNYIPNVGSIIAALPAVSVALLQFGPGHAAIVAALYVGVNFCFGNLLEPMLVGRQLGISTLVVILSLIFWGWVWGPMGMFLSVPLTMGVKIGLENSHDFRWIAFLMAAEPRSSRAADGLVRPSPQTPAPGRGDVAGETP
jgi:AI-2 transport protein TqsA